MDKILALFLRIASETLVISSNLAQVQKQQERLFPLLQGLAEAMARMARKVAEDGSETSPPTPLGHVSDDFQEQMLQFWMYAVVFRLAGEPESTWPAGIHQAMNTIAANSPILISSRAKQYFRSGDSETRERERWRGSHKDATRRG